MVRREAVLSTVVMEKPPGLYDTVESTDPNAVKWEDHIDALLHAAPSLEDIFNLTDPATGTVLLRSPVGGPLFATGLMELNRHRPINTMGLVDRIGALFGNDALLP